MKKTKRISILGKIFAGFGALCVCAGIVFSVLWFVPSIHDKIWTPADSDTTTTTDDTADKTTTDDTKQTV